MAMSYINYKPVDGNAFRPWNILDNDFVDYASRAYFQRPEILLMRGPSGFPPVPHDMARIQDLFRFFKQIFSESGAELLGDFLDAATEDIAWWTMLDNVSNAYERRVHVIGAYTQPLDDIAAEDIIQCTAEVSRMIEDNYGVVRSVAVCIRRAILENGYQLLFNDIQSSQAAATCMILRRSGHEPYSKIPTPKLLSTYIITRRDEIPVERVWDNEPRAKAQAFRQQMSKAMLYSALATHFGIGVFPMIKRSLQLSREYVLMEARRFNLCDCADNMWV